MGDLTLAYKVRSYSTGTLGRAICNARTHHFVADDAGGEEVGAGELFLSGISACAVNMVERLAKEQHIPLQWMDVGVEAYRDPTKTAGDRSVYDAIRVHFEMWGSTKTRPMGWSKPGSAADRSTGRSPWRPLIPPWSIWLIANCVDSARPTARRPCLHLS